MRITDYCRNYVEGRIPTLSTESSNQVPSKVKAPALRAGSAGSENKHRSAIIRGFPLTLQAKLGLVL